MACSPTEATPMLSLTFSLRASGRRASRLYSVAVAANGDRVASTEAQRSPAEFVTAITVPTEQADVELIWEVDGISRGAAVLSVEDLIQSAESSLPLVVRFPEGMVELYAEFHRPELVSHVAGFQVSRRGILNANRLAGVPECVVVVSRRRKDGTWVGVYRSAGDLRKKGVGGKLLSTGRGDGADVAVKVEVFAVGRGGGYGKAIGTLMCSLKYLRERNEGASLPLVDELNRRAGYCLLRSVKTSKAISWFDMDVYAYGKGGIDRSDMAVIVVNDAAESVPALEKRFRIGVDELRAMAERKQGQRLRRRFGWSGMFKLFRLPWGIGRMNEAALRVIQNVERDRVDAVQPESETVI